MSITVNRLTKRFGTQVAVDHISFHIEKGIVGFLGPNGAGKSTTMKMITGYTQADEGEVLVNGVGMHPDNTEAKKTIGYLPESNPLYADMYVREYLQFVAGVHNIHHHSEKIDEVIKLTGLSMESHKKIGQLSKGYKQRVGLSAALLHDPKVLVLDEPTSGLDPNQIIEIRNLIKSLAASRTILFSSHIMQEVEMLCERVIIINKGKIVADDSLDNLRNRSAGRQYVLVEFAERIKQADLQVMQKVISIVSMDPTEKAWKIETEHPAEIRKALLQLSIDRELNILSLQNEVQNLESVFQSLTL